MTETNSNLHVIGEDFRRAMRKLTGGVSVITVGKGADISGMTVTSVSSLSVDPATVIVSINRQTSSWPLLQHYGIFGVNILSADQVDIAERFSGRDGLKGAARFSGARWLTQKTGVPILVDAAAALDCEVEEMIERHSHAIVIGRVRQAFTSQDLGGLAYRQGEYLAVDTSLQIARAGEKNLPAA